MLKRPLSLLFALVLILLGGASASAERIEFETVREGARVAGSEICFYPALSEASPLALYFASNDVRCLPADQVISMPKGIWHFFARHPSGLVSVHRTWIVYDKIPDNRDYRGILLELAPSATVDLSAAAAKLGINERLALWIDDGPHALGTLIPVSSREFSVAVPADRAFVPLLVRDGRPVAVGDAVVPQAGETHAVSGFTRRPGFSDVIAWIKVDTASVKAAENPDALSSFQTKLRTADGVVLKPLFGIVHPRSASFALQVFKDVPRGRGTLTLSGETWLTEDHDIDLGDQSFVDEPLIATAAGRAVVSWNIPPLAQREPARCEGDAAAPRHDRVTISKCPNRGNAGETCVVTESRALREPVGKLAFDGLSPGRYEVMLHFAELQPQRGAVDVKVGNTAEVDLALPDFFYVFGMVSRGSRAIHGRVTFATGSTVSGVDGRYEALLDDNPKTNLITIVECSGGTTYRHIVAEPLADGSVYDIELPSGTVHLKLRSSVGTGLENATASLGVMKSATSKAAHYIVDGQSTSPTAFTFDAVPLKRPFVICAEASGHERACTDPVTLTDEKSEREINLQLLRAAYAGKVVSSVPLQAATLFWSTPSGEITEQVEVETGGNFSYRQLHLPGEVVSLVSANKPLTVLVGGMPETDGVLHINLPAGRARSFEVRVASPNRAIRARVALHIGGRYVPENVLVHHQSLRDADVRLAASGTLTILDVLESASITVTLGLPLDQERIIGAGRDIMLDPAIAATLVTKALGEAIVVAFP